jgi:hypothetical protein
VNACGAPRRGKPRRIKRALRSQHHAGNSLWRLSLPRRRAVRGDSRRIRRASADARPRIAATAALQCAAHSAEGGEAS